MTRYLAIAGGVVLIGAVGWAGLWFAGRGEVEEQITLGIERLKRDGLIIETGSLGIGGFPFAYVAQAKDVTVTNDTGIVIELPTVEATVALGAEAEVTVTLPATGLVTVPAPQSDAEPMTLTELGTYAGRYRLDMDDAIVLLSREETIGAPIWNAALTATSVKAVREPEAGQLGVEVLETELTAFGVNGSFAPPPPGPEGLGRVLLNAERIDYLLAERSDRGARSADLQVTDYTLTARIPRNNPTGDRRVSLQTGFVAATVANEMTPEAGAGAAAAQPVGGYGGKIDLSAETGAALLVVEDGQLSASTTIDEIGLRLTPTDPGVALRGAAAVDRLDISVAQPVDDQATDGAPLSMRLAAGILELDDDAWAALDPEGALKRVGAEFHAEMKGQMRAGAPGRLGWRGIETLEADVFLSALDAKLDGDVDLAFDPDGQPAGGGQVRFVNSMSLLRDLITSGLLSPQQAEIGFVLAGRFTKPGDQPEELVSDIAIDRGFLMVNGEPLIPLPALPVPAIE